MHMRTGGPGTNQHATKPRRPVLSLAASAPSRDDVSDIDPTAEFDPATYAPSRQAACGHAAEAAAVLRDRPGNPTETASAAIDHVNAASRKVWDDMHALTDSGHRTQPHYRTPSAVLEHASPWPDRPSQMQAATAYAEQAVLDLAGPPEADPDAAANQMMTAYQRLGLARQALRNVLGPDEPAA
jgi:hypothetical protein